jgi:hypothetical protein
MTGPSLAPLIIPIAGTLLLTAWLTLVFFAGRLPRRAAGHPARGHEDPGPSRPQRSEDVRVVFEVER